MTSKAPHPGPAGAGGSAPGDRTVTGNGRRPGRHPAGVADTTHRRTHKPKAS
ncbi:hypothetical protein [Streptomyces iranensis]|uniref:Uncharacterized protein n=1 Tax=Streptomyces iranensis TaxID=576784 RepID=A0A060ZVY8_9ACTN|nr:hypothetical protein [Streptomyces iranensis]MBP2062466.1 hypothetical protein [Streptomyces iranensis]CDR07324.1 predicted protein [Streptomyces iranensis]